MDVKDAELLGFGPKTVLRSRLRGFMPLGAFTAFNRNRDPPGTTHV